MPAKKRGLGKGLDALLGTSPDISSSGSLQTLSVDLIQRGQFQPRSNFDQEALEELADSIRAQGMVQPIIIRPLSESKKYEIIAGERRWRAAQIAGMYQVPVVIKDVPDQAAMCMALIENIQREDLNPLEEAHALERLIKEFEMTHEGIAGAVGRSRSAVSNLLRLLELTNEVKEMLKVGEVEMGHARALLALSGARQIEAARKVFRRGLSVRATEVLVRNLAEQANKKQKTAIKADPNIIRLQIDLSERLGAKVTIKQQGKGKGILHINYNSLDELEGILDHIK